MDRLAPDSGNVNVTNTPSVVAVLENADGESYTTTVRGGHVSQDTSDTDVRRLLEDILILLSENLDRR